MKPRMGITAQAVLILLLIDASSAIAQDDVCALPAVTDGGEAFNVLQNLIADRCLGAERCTTRLCDRVNDYEKEWKGNKATALSLSEATDIYDQIADDVAQLPADGIGVRQLNMMLREWKPLMEKIRSFGGTDPWKPRTVLFAETDSVIDLRGALGSCGTQAGCGPALSSASKVFAYVTLVYRVLETITSRPLGDTLDQIARWDRQWDSYLSESRAIYPWELLVNSGFYEPPEVGFQGPPNYQLLFLHPSVAMAYNDASDDKLEAALVMDVLGFYRWNWGGVNQDSVTKPFGLALAMSWDGDSTGYGASVHLPKNYSISLTTDGDDTFFLLSVDLGNFLLDKRQAIDKFKAHVKELSQDHN